ncbi:MAG: hypothetical protein WCP06_13655 [Verrucomicrobiota bacterium]
MSEHIAIVGGGLAGLALGIGLRQNAVEATVWEAGRYPRHRVCGEFISGQGLGSIERLGLLKPIKNAGACWAKNAAFFEGASSGPARPLPQAALSISRYVLDELLAREFVRLGGELRVGIRWRGGFGPAVVRSNGRRVEPFADGWRLLGLKVHARNIALESDLEMHFVPSGYVGLSRLPGGEVNLCGLFRSRQTVPGLAKDWRNWLGGPCDSTLHSRLAPARFDQQSFCSVAGFSLRPQRAALQDECCVGDALTMIPPVTGNGMSMAFESAEQAVGPLVRFSRRELSWTEARQQIAEDCDRAFASRLRYARCLQWALFQPLLRPALLSLAAQSGWLWRELFLRTR